MFVKEAGEDEEVQRSASRTGVGGVDIQARGAGAGALHVPGSVTSALSYGG